MVPMSLAHVSWSRSPAPLKNPPAQEAFTQEVLVKLWAIAKLTPSKFHTYLPPAPQGDYEFSMSHQPHLRGKNLTTSTPTQGTWMPMFSPLGFPEPSQEPLMKEERISFFLLHVLPSLGHRGAILGISLIRIAPSPHGRLMHAFSQSYVP